MFGGAGKAFDVACQGAGGGVKGKLWGEKRSAPVAVSRHNPLDLAYAMRGAGILGTSTEEENRTGQRVLLTERRPGPKY